MIVRILSSGQSFKGLAAYLMHDPGADAGTANRVAWTHTLNCANDEASLAVQEMLLTARNAELLKQEAGIRAGGRSTQKMVKHVSLGWPSGETPSREEMIKAAESFLRAMKWQDHQIIVVAHSDRSHAHEHLMINAVHPMTGLRLDDNFERRRAQAWALAYEGQHGRVFCEERLKKPANRNKSLPRHIWMGFAEKQAEFVRAESNRHDQGETLSDDWKKPKFATFLDWRALKDIQRRERQAFFAEGRLVYSALRQSVYRSVRNEFRPRWMAFYKARRGGIDKDALATRRAKLVTDQKAVLETRRDAAYAELRKSRDADYCQLLDEQRKVRLDLRARQAAGLDNSLFLRSLKERSVAKCFATQNRMVAEMVAARQNINDRLVASRAPMNTCRAGSPVRADAKAGTGTASARDTGLFFLSHPVPMELLAPNRILSRGSTINLIWVERPNRASAEASFAAQDKGSRAFNFVSLHTTMFIDQPTGNDSGQFKGLVTRLIMPDSLTAQLPRHFASSHWWDEPCDEDKDAEFGIELLFRQKLAGLRHLPRDQRLQALRAARQWRSLALKLLREKRNAMRRLGYILARPSIA
jgi:hypothetical protein